tara:strand:- start:813 stop:1982 length:1170 start_codon:yes stop_codon:yes gene_type:complete
MTERKSVDNFTVIILIDYFYRAVESHYDGVFDTQEAKKDSVCNCCERPIKETPAPTKLVIASVYGKNVTHCLPCQTLFGGNKMLLGAKSKGRVEHTVMKEKVTPEVLSIVSDESLTKVQKTKKLKQLIKLVEDKGKAHNDAIPSMEIFISKEKSVFVKAEHVNNFTKYQKTLTEKELLKWFWDNDALVSKSKHKKLIDGMKTQLLCINEGGEEQRRFGMLVGLGAVIHSGGVVIYAPGKHFQNLSQVENFPFELVPLGGSMMKNDVIRRFADHGKILVIDDFGKKKAELVKNLKMSESKNEITFCNDDGSSRVDIASYNKLRQFFDGQVTKQIHETTYLIRRLLSGTDTPADTMVKLADVDGIQSLLIGLPTDPHEAISLLLLIDKIYG